MVRAIGARCAGAWAALPASEVYGWQFLIHHLRGAGLNKEADVLLTDYTWIKAKLRISGARAYSVSQAGFQELSS